MKTNKRQIALKRAKVLKSRIQDYLDVLPSISKGIDETEFIKQRQTNIRKEMDCSLEEWNDWHWQLTHRIKTSEELTKYLPLTQAEIDDINQVSKTFRWAISPYYLSLIHPGEFLDPIKLLAVPSFLELEDTIHDLDPMGEEFTNPAGYITRRYPDRLIINVTNECAMYCRHCQRRRNIGDKDRVNPKSMIDESILYIRNNPEIRDVLITGGDPLTMSNRKLESIIAELRSIQHVEIIRIGSRTPVTLPMRITDKLVSMLKKYHPIYLNTHFNHPMEVTLEAKRACEKLANAGIVVGNQAVLLNGINNDKFVMRCLNQELLKIRVRPYYLFHAKAVKGTMHFNTSINDGLDIMEYLRGYTSGLAIPYYIVNAPLGKGKTPILPDYILSKDKESFTLRTWENEVIVYENHETVDLKKFFNMKYQKKV